MADLTDRMTLPDWLFLACGAVVLIIEKGIMG